MGLFKSLMSVISTDGKTGTPYKLDNHTLYYKGDGVTKPDAAIVATFFKEFGYFRENGASAAQISAEKTTDPLKISFFFEKEPDKDVLNYFLLMATEIKPLFPDREISLSIIDSHFKETKSLGVVSNEPQNN